MSDDFKPIMDRATFAAVWRMLNEQIAVHETMARPHLTAIGNLREQQCTLAEAAGFDGEPEAWCEFCGAPFGEGDDRVWDDEGVTTCRFNDDGSRSEGCFKADMVRVRAALHAPESGDEVA